MFCPNCGSNIEEGNAFCSQCGFSVERWVNKKPELRCSSCGSELKENYRFCKNCGAKTDTVIAPLMPLAKKKNRITTKQIWLIVAVSVVFLFAMAAILLWVFGVFDVNKNETKIEPEQEVAANEKTEDEENVQEEVLAKTPEPTVQQGPLIKDEALREGIILTLENMGESVGEELTITDLEKIEVLKLKSPDCPDNVYVDYIKINGVIENIEGLNYAVNITELCLPTNNIVDISALKHLFKLKVLDISDNQVQKINDLSELVLLENLSVTGLNLSDMSVVADLPNITSLYVGNDIEDISPVYNMVQLESLGFCGDVDDISGLSSLTNLKWLLISGTRISDISVLENFANLEGLFINDTRIEDISVLEQLENLTFISMDNGTYENNSDTITILEERNCLIFHY